jgi:hypothetical protein
MGYTDQSTIEAFLKRSLTSNETTLLTPVLTVVDNFINNRVNNVGWNSDAASTKYYDGGSKILDIDPCTSITKVYIVNEEETEYYEYDLNEEFEAKPRNEDVKTYLEKRVGKFPKGVSNIAVDATFSRGSTVPEDIKWLATYLSAQLYTAAIKSNLKSESIEGYSRTFLSQLWDEDSKVKNVLNYYNEDDFCL